MTDQPAPADGLTVQDVDTFALTAIANARANIHDADSAEVERLDCQRRLTMLKRAAADHEHLISLTPFIAEGKNAEIRASLLRQELLTDPVYQENQTAIDRETHHTGRITSQIATHRDLAKVELAALAYWTARLATARAD